VQGFLTSSNFIARAQCVEVAVDLDCEPSGNTCYKMGEIQNSGFGEVPAIGIPLMRSRSKNIGGLGKSAPKHLISRLTLVPLSTIGLRNVMTQRQLRIEWRIECTKRWR
jgi:hypothetical protein